MKKVSVVNALTILLIFTALPVGGSAPAQAAPAGTPLAAPKWAVGDWWVVESQVFNTGEVVRGAKPGWTPPREWRFTVEKIEKIGGQPYFVVSIRPGDGNKSPYWFRHWYRVSDRYLGRTELHHPDPEESTKRQPNWPSVVRRNFTDVPPGPYLTDEFPDLPVAMPLFGKRQGKLAPHKASGEPRMTQSFDQAGEAGLLRAAPRIGQKLKSASAGNSTLVRLSTSETTEQQYWNPNVPWCLYGERSREGQVLRRYWLVDMGGK